MSNIDQRVVQMLFDNTSFEHNAATSLATLDKLNKNLQLEGASKGFSSLGDAVKSVSMDPLAAGVDHVAERFTAMSVVGYTILATLTQKIVDTGLQLAKSFTIDPIKAGFENYETQINAVQTILANTSAEGTKIGDVNKALAELNTYANQTIYNFSEMTQNIGTFTAAGVDLKTSVESIKGIANLAAISGSNSQQASTAMYQLSQAIASGKVSLQDWNSVVNAGLGGKTFQTALENTARASGVAIDSIVKKAGGFRNSLQEGWLTSDVLTKTLSQFTGDLSAAQLKAMGFTADEAKQIQAMGKTAVDAATQIKTGTQLVQALKEEVATAYASVFKTIFGNIGQATDLFSKMHNVAENALTGPIYALNTLLQGWANLGGRTELIKAFSQAFQDLGLIIKPIKEAFREIFPPATAQELLNLTDKFEHLTEKLKIGAHTSDDLRLIFAGFFSVIKIGFDILEKLAGTLGRVFGLATQGSGGILDFAARVGDFLVRLKNAVEQGDKLNDFFARLETVLSVPILMFQALTQYVKELFDRFDPNKAEQALGVVKDKLGPIGQLADIANRAWGWLIDKMGAAGPVVQQAAVSIGAFLKKMGQDLVGGLSNINFKSVLDTFDTGLFAGLILLVKKFVDKFKGGGGELGGFLDTIKETFEGLTKTFETMQNTLKAATLLEIALAIGVLTISVGALSKIDGNGLTKASAALTVMFTQLVASLAIFQKFIGTEGFLKMPFIMLSLILLAGAIDVLAVSVIKLGNERWETIAKGLFAISEMLTDLAASVRLMGDPEHMISTGLGLDALAKGIKILGEVVVGLGTIGWEELAKGLTGLAGILTSLTLFSLFASADSAGAAQGLGIILLAAGIKILASAVHDIGKESWTTIAKGLDLMAGSLSAIALALKVMPPSSIFSAAGVLIVASSLGLIGDAVAKMGKEDWKEIAHGLVLMAGALGIIAGALALLPPSSLLSAAAIFIVASSLGMITTALDKMGAQGWTTIAKGLIELAGALTIISASVILMTEGLPGAAALLVVATALDILTPALKAFGEMSWTDILQSLVELAGLFAILAVAGVLLAPVVPVLVALGGAITLLGIGTLTAGAGILLLSAGLTALSIAGGAGTAAMVLLVTSLLTLIPLAAKELAQGLIVFAQTVGQGAPVIAKAFVSILSAILDTLVSIIPKIVDMLLKLLSQLLDALVKYTPHLVDAGVKLIIGLLEGLTRNMPKLVGAGVDCIVAFIEGVGNQVTKLVQAGFDLVIKFITGLGEAIKQNTPRLVDALFQMGLDIIDGLVNGIKHAGGKVLDALESVASDAWHGTLSFLGIESPSKRFMEVGRWTIAGWAKGVEDNSGMVTDAHTKVAQNALDVVSQTMSIIGDHINDNMDLSPRIKPVLDLSNLKGSVFDINNPGLSVDVSNGVSYNKAAIASEGYSKNNSRGTNWDTIAATKAMPSYNFTQNNYSPKALSDADIYRQTNNQLSAVRGTLVYQSGGTQ